MGGMTRRQVLTGMTVGTAAVALPTFVFTSIEDGRVRGFTIDHADDIQVWVGNGERFRLEVRRGDEAIEVHDDLTAASLFRLESEHITIVEAPIPTPA